MARSLNSSSPLSPSTRAPSRPREPKAKLPPLRLDLALEEYARDLRRRDLSAKTIQTYRQILSLANRFWEERLARPPTVQDLTVRQGEAFLDHLLERGKLPQCHRLAEGRDFSPESLRSYIRALKVFSSWLAAPKQQYTRENQLALLAMPRKSETYKQPLDTPEVQELIEACDITTVNGTRDLAILLTFLDGGLRAADLQLLKVSQVNLETGKLFIAEGKGRKSRVVTLGDQARHLLRRYAFLRDAAAGAKASPDAPFFQNKYGRAFAYNGLRALLRRVKTRAGVERVFLHLLRHTSAVRTLEVPGADLVTLQEKLGHADIATTRRYIHMTQASLSERQRAFSPIDHLGVKGLMRLVAPEKTDGRFFHKRPRREPEVPPRRTARQGKGTRDPQQEDREC
jgi:integrase/recombinase XerD